MKRSNQKILAGVLVIGIAVGFLIVRGISTTSAYYLTVAELKDSPTGRSLKAEQSVRVGGDVVAGSIAYDQQALRLAFDLRDQQNPAATIRVSYAGPKPDAFEPDVKVLAEGIYQRDANLFAADTLLVKCPSKYESKASGNEGGHLGTIR
jgi:cytochrome c-type biogenesis protein CcmE